MDLFNVRDMMLRDQENYSKTFTDFIIISSSHMKKIYYGRKINVKRFVEFKQNGLFMTAIITCYDKVKKVSLTTKFTF